MKQFECKFSYEEILPQNTEEDIAGLEQRIGYQLPSDYRKFLLEHNGIKFNHRVGVIWTKDDCEDDPVCELFKFCGITDEDTLESLEALQDGYKFSERVPKGYFAITDTFHPAQNLCISLNQDDLGKVYYWYAPSNFPEENEEPFTKKYLIPVANSFQEFWNNIRDLKELQIEMDIDESWR